MADTKTKTLVTIDKVGITKCWDKAAQKPVIDAAQKTLEKALGRAKGMEYAKAIKKGDKGLGVSVNFVSILFDDKKNVLTLKVDILVSKYPGPRMATTGGNPAKIEATRVDAKAALKRAPMLAADLVSAKIPNLVKVLQALAKSL